MITVLYTVEEKKHKQLCGPFIDLLNILKTLNRKLFEPIVLLTGDESAYHLFDNLNVSVYHLPFPPFRKGKGLPKFPITIYRLHKLLKQEKIDIIHINGGYNDMPFVSISSKLIGIPSIITIRSMPELIEKFSLYRYKWIDYYHLVSKAMETFMRKNGIEENRFYTIYSGVDLCYLQDGFQTNKECRLSLNIPLESPVVGMIANLSPIKGPEYLIRAISILKKKFPNLICLLIGGGDPEYVSKLKQLAKEVNVLERVIFTGFQRDVRRYRQAMDLCVLSSISEALPISLLEAMTMKKPVVASRVGGIPELVDDGVSGLLVPPQDDKALAEAISSILVDKSRAYQMGEAGRERVMKYFTINKTVANIQNMYLKIVRKDKTIKRFYN